MRAFTNFFDEFHADFGRRNGGCVLGIDVSVTSEAGCGDTFAFDLECGDICGVTDTVIVVSDTPGANTAIHNEALEKFAI